MKIILEQFPKGPFQNKAKGDKITHLELTSGASFLTFLDGICPNSRAKYCHRVIPTQTEHTYVCNVVCTKYLPKLEIQLHTPGS